MLSHNVTERGTWMRITLYLLREGLEASRVLLRNEGRFLETTLIEPESGVAWQLFSFAGEAHYVDWLRHLRRISSDPEQPRLFTQSSGAVLLVTVNGRVFAVTFGTGFHAVEQRHVEPDFGLRVAANSIDPDRISLAEARGLGKGARNAVSSLPVPNRMFALRLATNEEWVRRMGGFTIDTDFAASVNGADSLRLTIDDFELTDLPNVLRKALTKFNSVAYRDYLPHLDYFRRLATTHPLVPRLEAAVLEDLRARRSDVGFAAPDEFHFYNVDGFQLKRRRGEVWLRDLSSDAVYKALDGLDAWGDPLQSVKVQASAEGDWLGPPRPLGQYVVADVAIEEHGQQERFVLTAGAWFSIAPTYAAQLDAILGRVPDVTASCGLPVWDDAWLEVNVEGRYAEQRYNRHAADAPGRLLVDRNLYRGPAGERVEACDVLFPDKRLICVKRLDGSDTMIHLFEQGTVSATLLKKSPEYRDFVLDQLETAGGGRNYGAENDWTVVFAIATSRPGPIKELLPFFARASLAANLDVITDKGYNVALAKIEMKT